MERKPYTTDLTDEQWAILESLLSPAKPGGRPRKTNLREVINALLYINRNGCTWRNLPHDFPPWRTVYNYFRAWIDDGTWDQIVVELRMEIRLQAGRPHLAPARSIAKQSKPPRWAEKKVTMAARKSRGGNVTSPSIPWGCCWRWS